MIAGSYWTKSETSQFIIFYVKDFQRTTKLDSPYLIYNSDVYLCLRYIHYHYATFLWYWWHGLSVGQLYKVAMSAHCHKSVDVMIWLYMLPGHQTPTTNHLLEAHLGTSNLVQRWHCKLNTPRWLDILHTFRKNTPQLMGMPISCSLEEVIQSQSQSLTVTGSH